MQIHRQRQDRHNQKVLRNFQRPHEDTHQYEAEQQDDEVRQDQPERIGEYDVALLREQIEARLQAVGHQRAEHHGGGCAAGDAKGEHGDLRSADNRVVADFGLAVDRGGFSRMVTEKIRNHPNITVISEEITEVPEGPVIVATGPLTSDALSEAIGHYFGETGYLHFFDAAAPLVSAESIDMNLAWWQSRYDRGTPDYINCAMNKEQYEAFVRELVNAEEAPVHGFEDKNVFEGCMPVEVMARRGVDTLRYGPMKPVGLRNPATGHEPYAVVQLRQDNAAKSVYNLVGFQTHLKFGEQKRVFSMIPGLENAEFVRYGVMHQNTFLQSPKLLDKYYADRRNPLVAFAGQMTGVEGYVESTASGYLAAVAMAAKVQGWEVPDFPKETAIGALGQYVSDESIENFQPMNINFSIIAPLEKRIRKKAEKNLAIAARSLDVIDRLVAKGI